MKKQSANPVAILVLVTIWYVLKFGLESAVAGMSQAAVEGVAIGRDTMEKAMLISPLFVYLAFVLVYFSANLFGCCTERISHAVEKAFQFHIAFFVIALGAFALLAEGTVYTFAETFPGNVIMPIGDWLPLILVTIFTAVYATTSSNSKHGKTEPGGWSEQSTRVGA